MRRVDVVLHVGPYLTWWPSRRSVGRGPETPTVIIRRCSKLNVRLRMRYEGEVAVGLPPRAPVARRNGCEAADAVADELVRLREHDQVQHGVGADAHNRDVPVGGGEERGREARERSGKGLSAAHHHGTRRRTRRKTRAAPTHRTSSVAHIRFRPSTCCGLSVPIYTLLSWCFRTRAAKSAAISLGSGRHKP